MLGVMSAHSSMHRDVADQEAQIVAHEREQDTMDVIALSVIDHHATNSWNLAQHLSAIMSSQAEPAVQQRDPQPSQSHLVSTGGSSHFTAAPAQVHPHLRRLLQQPYHASASGGSSFIQVEPELQASLVAGVESMCKDVAEWNASATAAASSSNAGAPSAASENEGGSARQITPPEALAWSSTLQAQQKPMVSGRTPCTSRCLHPHACVRDVSSAHLCFCLLHRFVRTMCCLPW